MRRRKFWGWGYEGEGLSPDELGMLARLTAARFGMDEPRAADPPRIGDIRLREPRVSPPSSLGGMVTAEPWDRAEHTLGKSFADLVRGLRGEYSHPPDLVAYPADESEVSAVLDWATG